MLRRDITIAALALAMGATQAAAQNASSSAAIASLGLTPEEVSHLKSTIGAHDYPAAETLLLKEIQQDPHSARAGRLLAYTGSVYFLNQDYLNAAIAWKKSEAITPLAPDLQFSLAMAYIRIGRSAWARPVLEVLAAHDPKNAIYPYWLGRLDYEDHQYERAVGRFIEATALDPAMARAYDNLGLCYFYRNNNDLAVKAFTRSIELERQQPHPSPWPYVNLAATLEFLGRAQQAEDNLREALRLDPNLPEAHFQLGNVLAHQNQLPAAAGEFKEAIRLNTQYAQPHLALAHIYRRTGRKADAEEEIKSYVRLNGSSPKPGLNP